MELCKKQDKKFSANGSFKVNIVDIYRGYARF